MYMCPACGFKTRTEQEYGSYDICRVCGWEDDLIQYKNPLLKIGANKESLYEKQQQVLGMDLGNLKGSYEKDVNRIPYNLNELEIKSNKNIKNGNDYFNAFKGT